MSPRIILPRGFFPVGTPHGGLFGKAPLERGTVFRLQVYEGVGKSVILVCKKVQMA